MAEALANHLGRGKVRAWSAGSHPLGMILSDTHDVMQEKGIALEGHWSKGMRDVPIMDMNIVVGMGCEVVCPVPSGFKGRVVEWNIPDPYGHDLEYFRSVRNLIERQVSGLLEQVGRQQYEESGGARQGSRDADDET